MKQDKTKSFNMDCLEFMAKVPDNFYDLAIVDPPYGIARFGNRVELSNRIDKTVKINKWDKKPTQEYFAELFRISKNQIIWGANNFVMPPSEYFCIWNKKQTVENFASAEYAWVSMGLKKPAQIFEYSIHKTMSDRKDEGGKIHPTQKPVKLYEWLLMNYAKEGDKILDTHGGSQSSRIACFNLGFELDIIELDQDYFDKGNKRFEQHKKQLTLF
jgi:site-specific DNA-methyltransferase (adenine-specific)